ncbi:MAG TPA: hypothetical protein VKE95_02835 [Burkholderiales bacterium]|nr:hypothetical protein [Burkholderiales bacterium]
MTIERYQQAQMEAVDRRSETQRLIQAVRTTVHESRNLRLEAQILRMLWRRWKKDGYELPG